MGFRLSLATRRRRLSSERPNSCTLHAQIFFVSSSGLQQYYLELLPSSCLPLLCLYYGLLIVWQDWQAPWQSWLKALRSEKWDRYRANTCLLAVSQSPVGCVLHWHRINGSIKTQPRQVFLAHVTMLLWLAKNIFTSLCISCSFVYNYNGTDHHSPQLETVWNKMPTDRHMLQCIYFFPALDLISSWISTSC